MERRVIPELLDDDLGTPEEIASSLRDLRDINEWFGGTRTTTTLLRRIASLTDAKQLSLLEVGAGWGDVPLAAARVLARSGITIQATLLDRLWTHLPRNSVPSVSCDVVQMPFRDDAFDVVSCSLFAHHFDRQSLLQLCAEALRVSRRTVLINDLIRSRLHLGLVYLGLPLFRSRITWHDAPASVRNAYTISEMRSVLNGLQAKRVEVSSHYLFRMGVLIWK